MSYCRLSALESFHSGWMELGTRFANPSSSAMPSPTDGEKEPDFAVPTLAKRPLIEKLRDQWHLVFEDLQDASYQNGGLKASQKAQLAELLQAYQEACEALLPS